MCRSSRPASTSSELAAQHPRPTFWHPHGIPVKVVSQRLGHANTAITSDLYQHVLKAMDAEAANTVACLILDGEQQESKSSAVNPRQRDGLSPMPRGGEVRIRSSVVVSEGGLEPPRPCGH